MDYLAEGGYALLGPPGAQFSYCNEGFALLGAIIERVSGQGYEPYVQRHILDPAGMTRSTYDVATLRTFGDVITFHAARQTDGKREVYAAPNWLYSSVWSPAGSLNTSVRDLLRYLEIYRTGGVTGDARLLSAEGIARMTTPFAPRSSPGSSYGYGLGVVPDYHGQKLIKHGGGRKGISAEIIVAPALGFTGAAIAGLAGIPVATVTLAALNRTLGLPVDAPDRGIRGYTVPRRAPAALHRHLSRRRGPADHRQRRGWRARLRLRGQTSRRAARRGARLRTRNRDRRGIHALRHRRWCARIGGDDGQPHHTED